MTQSIQLIQLSHIYWSLQPADKEYTNIYGNRDVGVVAAQYDEFFFRSFKKDGTVTVPRDYIKTPNAQSFLNFGVDPKNRGKAQKLYDLQTRSRWERSQSCDL